MSRIDVVLGFDMQTDVGSFSPFYTGLEKGTPRILELLRQKDCAATFFFTGEAAHAHPEIVRAVVGARPAHEIGCHGLYHETYGDQIFDIPLEKPLLPEELANRLGKATRIVEAAAGVRPVSFRCPRLFGSTAVVRALDELGYVADATYPMYHYEKRLVPYHPSASDWLEQGSMRIVEIPNFADMVMESQDQYGRDRDQWPLYRTGTAELLLDRIDSFVDFVSGKGLPAVLCFYLHPWEFEEMPSRFDYGEAVVYPHEFIVQNCGDYALEQLGVLIDRLSERGATFRTCKGVAKDAG